MIAHRSRRTAGPSTPLALLTPLAMAAVCLLGAGPGCSSSDGGGTGGAGGTGGGTGGSTGGSGGSTGGTGGSGALTTYKVCDRDKSHGGFAISLNDDDPNPALRYTGIGGKVMDGVEQVTQAKLVKEVGGCRILQPPEAFMCTPACDLGTQDCTPTGCKPKPHDKDLGKVTVSGLKTGSVELTHSAGLFSYDYLGMLPHPGFDEGANLSLQATGKDGYGPFTLKGWGVAPLVVPTAPVTVTRGQPVTLTWTPPSRPGPTRMFIDFSINRHGAIDSWLECTAEDTGSYTITGAMTEELFKNGVSGFPSVNLTRQSGDTTTVQNGCVQLLVTAPISRQLNVTGVVSCNSENPCPGGKMCRDDLTCPP
jgi:hypothetical protein